MPSRINDINSRLETIIKIAEKGNDISADEALAIADFFVDYQNTNNLISEADILANSNPSTLKDIVVALKSNAEQFLSLHLNLDLNAYYNNVVGPLEKDWNENKAISDQLWKEYSYLSNRLDYISFDDPEFKEKEKECDTVKAKYDTAKIITHKAHDSWYPVMTRYYPLHSVKASFLNVLMKTLADIADAIICDLAQGKETAQ